MRVGQEDLDFVLEHNADDFRAFAGAHIFITGGTGFVGKWLLETLLEANKRLSLRVSITALTREPKAFSALHPQLADDPALRLTSGDVRTFSGISDHADAIIHAATPASAKLNSSRPHVMLETIIAGGQRVLEFAERSGEIPFLFTSSGAVYGRQPPELDFIDEDYSGGPDQLNIQNAYHEGKRCAELQCAIAASRGVRTKIARLFAFVGPYLPIDRHFAVGNFIGDAIRGGPIIVGGDGTPQRSYLYGADMAVWLWRILARGEVNRAYNVGAEDARSIFAIAEAVADAAGANMKVEVRSTAIPGALPERYVPSTRRAHEELSLLTWTPFDEALSRTILWHRRLARV